MSSTPSRTRGALLIPGLSVALCLPVLLGTLGGGGQLLAQQDFLRGDFDGNGVVEPVVDYFFLNGNWDFQTNTFPTTCEDAADFDDNGTIDLNDAVGLLASWWGFGNLIPPAPGVLVCGPDPTPDALDCVSTGCSPPAPPPLLAGSSLEIESVSADLLEEIEVKVVLDHAQDLIGFSFAVCHDPTKLVLLGLGLGPDLPIQSILIPNEFNHIDANGMGWDFAYISDSFGNPVLPAGNREILVPRYQCLEAGSTTIETCTTIGPIPMPPRAVLPDLSSFEIATVAGVVDVTTPPLLNDSCASPTPIQIGSRLLTTGASTDDGPDLSGSCSFAGTMGNDVWFTYPVSCNGLVEVTLESTAFAPRIAVYSSPACPATGASLIACADDSSTPSADHAAVDFDAQVGQVLLIQVGGAGTGLATLHLTCTSPPSYVPLDELSAPLTTIDGRFGAALAISGSTLAVTELRDDTNVPRGGSVHVYEKSGGTWGLEQTLIMDPPEALAQFGISVALDGDTLAAGVSPLNPVLTPEVFIFERAGGVWSLTSSVSDQSLSTSSYGDNIALSGDVLAVGGAVLGMVKLYRKAGGAWIEEQTLISSDPMEQQFGALVALDGDQLLVADPTSHQGAGRGYIYDFDGVSWTLSATLAASDGETSDFFGFGIALSGGRAFLGAPLHDALCPMSLPFTCESGAVYIFDTMMGPWSQVAKIEAEFPMPLDFFGSHLAALPNGDFIASSSEGFEEPGAVHYFQRVGSIWVPTQVFRDTPPTPDEGYGFTLALGADDLVIGASLDDTLGIDTGRVSIYEGTGVLPVGDFVRADCNQDSNLNIADAVSALSFLFPPPMGPPSINCLDACDANDDGGVDIGDAVAILGSLFGNPPGVIPPPNACGPDPVLDSLGCAVSGGACP